MRIADITIDNLFDFLNQVKHDRCRIEQLYEIIHKPIEVNQRLTASYGTERVQGGAIFSDPTLTALIRANAKADFALEQLSEINENIDYAKYLVKLVEDPLEWRCLYQFYIMDRSLKDIATNLGCTSKSWAEKLLVKAKKSLLKEFAK